jgi:hypothetical protein
LGEGCNAQIGEQLVYLLDESGLLCDASQSGVKREGPTGFGEEAL